MVKRMEEYVRPRGDVRCIETGEVFESVAHAGACMALMDPAIYAYVTGRRKSPVKGYTFEYVYDQTDSIRGRKLLK